MRKRIQDLSKGVFVYEGPDVVIDSEGLELVADEGENLTGQVKLTSKNGVPMRGIVYSTHGRMECKKLQFEGEAVEIPYEFYSKGLVEGDVHKGKFYFICNGGEYSLPFRVQISKTYLQTSKGVIQTLGQFLLLARSNEQEAYELFCNKYFINIFKENDFHSKLLYECLGGQNTTKENLEEFLFTLGLKDKMTFALVEDQVELCDVVENRKESIFFRKTGWGYKRFEMRTNTAFLIPMQAQFSTNDFLGHEIQLDYLVDSKWLRTGKNFGSIVIDNGDVSFEYRVCIHQDTQHTLIRNQYLEEQQRKLELAVLYRNFRTGKQTVGIWAEQSLEKLDQIDTEDVEKGFYFLYKAQVLFASGRKQEASWLLSTYKKERAGKETPEYAYYLYLTTLVNREPAYVRKIAEKINIISFKNQNNMFLFWIRLFICEEYVKHKGRKFQVIMDQIQKGCASPFIYAEGYQLVKEEPFLLHELNENVLRLLKWISKENLLNRDLVQRIIELTQPMKFYCKSLHKLLVQGYLYWKNKEVVMAICQNLLRGECYGKEFYSWYQLGIELELHITNLYEAFLMCSQNWNEVSYPRVIQYYLKFETRLPAKQKANLYAGMVQNKQIEKTVYQNAIPDMEKFILQQLTEGRMDESLAVIYQDYMESNSLNANLAQKLSNVAFIQKIDCKHPNMVKVILFQSHLNQVISVPIVHQKAYLPIYGSEYLIAFEDRFGRRYIKSVEYEHTLLMKLNKPIKDFLELVPLEKSYLLYHFLHKPEFEPLETEEISPVLRFLAQEVVSEAGKNAYRIKLVEYFLKSRTYDRLEEYLQNDDLKGYTGTDQRFLIGVMIDRNLFQIAYERLKRDDFQNMDTERLRTFLTAKIEECNFEVDDFLLQVSFFLFEKRIENEKILSYLAKYFYGTCRQMEQLWIATRNIQIDTFDLEERILVQMLYTEAYLQYCDEIFAHYMESNGKKLVQQAYLAYFAFRYVIHDSMENQFILGRIEIALEQKEDVIDMEKLALLKGYSESEVLSDKKFNLAFLLYQEFAIKKVRLGFFKDLPLEVTNQYPINELRYLEHRSKPGTKVVIHYRIGTEEFFHEEMEVLFPGVYGKEFVLFFGDTFEYYISEWVDNEEQTVVSGTVENREYNSEAKPSLFFSLNEIIYDVMMGDLVSAKFKIQLLNGKRRWIQDNFKLME